MYNSVRLPRKGISCVLTTGEGTYSEKKENERAYATGPPGVGTWRAWPESQDVLSHIVLNPVLGKIGKDSSTQILINLKELGQCLSDCGPGPPSIMRYLCAY